MPKFYATFEVRVVVTADNEDSAKATIFVAVSEMDVDPIHDPTGVGIDVKGMDIMAITEK